MPLDDTAEAIARLQISTFDDALGHRIIGTHMWAVREGLRGADAHDLFDGYCQRLVVDGTQLWRAHTAMETLHPQWSGYGYTWRRDLNAIEPENTSTAVSKRRIFSAALSITSSSEPKAERKIPPCAGASNRTTSVTSRFW